MEDRRTSQEDSVHAPDASRLPRWRDHPGAGRKRILCCRICRELYSSRVSQHDVRRRPGKHVDLCSRHFSLSERFDRDEPVDHRDPRARASFQGRRRRAEEDFKDHKICGGCTWVDPVDRYSVGLGQQRRGIHGHLQLHHHFPVPDSRYGADDVDGRADRSEGDRKRDLFVDFCGSGGAGPRTGDFSGIRNDFRRA